MRVRLRRLAAIASVLMAGSALAAPAPVSDGTYVLDGGSYSIDVRREGDRLIVIEPNDKHSPYAWDEASRSYFFYNPNTDADYGIRFIDRQTIEAFKPVPGNVPTRLVRLGGAPIEMSAVPAGVEMPAAPAGAEPRTVDPTAPAQAEDYGAMADRYQKRALSEPDNIQAWTACSAVALKRSLASQAEAEAYAGQVARTLSLILVEAGTSPCPEAIPASAFPSAGGTTAAAAVPAAAAATAAEAAARQTAEQERIAELNRRADARNAATAAEHQRVQAEYEARAKAFEAATREFDAARATHEAEVAKARAAEAEYQRKLKEHQAQTGGK